MARDLDVVVFGATGDTGILGCCCCFFRGRRLGLASWAPAARNMGKLQTELLDRLGVADPGPDGLKPHAPIEADCDDHASLVRMCARTTCVLSCAGPYSYYGEGVVRACIEAGTHYVDITGEVDWVQSMMRKYGDEAARKGLVLVSCAGYDSVPPDLATFLAAKALEERGETLGRFEVFVSGGGGAMPTGTINTMCKALAKRKQRLLRAATFGLLGGGDDADNARVELPAVGGEGLQASFVPQAEQANLRRNLFWTMLPGYSSLGGGFFLPHFMAGVNLPVVHRSAAVYGYGGLEYRERGGPLPTVASLYGLLPTALGIGAVAAYGAICAMPYSTKLILAMRDSFNPPKVKKVRDAAFAGFASTGTTSLQGFGTTANSHRKVRVELESDYDPGLGFTMLSACTVAAEVAKRAAAPGDFRHGGGFHTAVCAIGGSSLADALRNAGMRIEVSVS